VKKLIALVIILLVVFVVVERKRVYVRDPLASVTRDGAKVDGEQVFINFYNDVLLENDNPPMHLFLAEQGQPIGIPTKLRCIHWVACLTDADIATTYRTASSINSMTSKAVVFHDESGRRWTIKLR